MPGSTRALGSGQSNTIMLPLYDVVCDALQRRILPRPREEPSQDTPGSPGLHLHSLRAHQAVSGAMHGRATHGGYVAVLRFLAIVFHAGTVSVLIPVS